MRSVLHGELHAVVRGENGRLVTEKDGVLWAQQCARRAELRAVIEALKLGKGKRVNIYTQHMCLGLHMWNCASGNGLDFELQHNSPSSMKRK